MITSSSCGLIFVPYSCTKSISIMFTSLFIYRGILADVVVYIFAHLHSALPTEGKVLDIN